MVAKTLLTTAQAAELLHSGQVIAYPTEAVYGLGCDPRNETAVRNILTLKSRHESAGLVLIASGFEQLEPWVADVDRALFDQAMATWPGPVTWLFPRAPGVPDFVAGEHDTVAVRITAHVPSRQLCAAFGSALISTSANPSTAPPARSADEVRQYFGNRLAGILAGELGDGLKPSEIRDLASGRVIRAG